MATWTTTDVDFEQFAHAMFNASLAHHLVKLDEVSLRKLADNGILLIDEAKILAKNFSYDAVFVFTSRQVITAQDKRQWDFPRFTPYSVFQDLRDFGLIQRHILRLPHDGRTWDDLSHAERLHVSIAYLAMAAPLHMYMTRLQRRSREKSHRSTRLVPLAKALRGRTH